MNKGIAYAIVACFIWGLIFVIPPFLQGFSAVEIALGRYFFYGLLSLVFLFKSGRSFSREVWKDALRFSLISNIGYYTAIVLSLQYCHPAICALISGLNPIVIACYGNWKTKEIQYKSLIVPSILILVGLFFINSSAFSSDLEGVLVDQLLGIFFALVALGTWSWYAVANSQFLRKHPDITPNEWSTLMGVATLIGVLILFGAGLISPTDHIELATYLTWTPELKNFIIGCSILGFLCSWVGTYFWNKATINLPVSLVGQLTIFETIFGVIFVCLAESRIPPLQEGFGIILMLGAILYGIRSAFQKKVFISH